MAFSASDFSRPLPSARPVSERRTYDGLSGSADSCRENISQNASADLRVNAPARASAHEKKAFASDITFGPDRQDFTRLSPSSMSPMREYFENISPNSLKSPPLQEYIDCLTSPT